MAEAGNRERPAGDGDRAEKACRSGKEELAGVYQSCKKWRTQDDEDENWVIVV